MYLLHMG